MIKFFTYAISIILLVAINAVFPEMKSALPNLLFLFIIFLAFRQNEADFIWIAFFSGLFLDAYSGFFFGTYTISFLVIGFIINLATRSILTADPSPIYVAVVIVISELMLVGLVFMVNAIAFKLHQTPFPVSGIYLNQKIWIDLALNLIFALPVYWLVRLNDSIIENIESKKNILS